MANWTQEAILHMMTEVFYFYNNLNYFKMFQNSDLDKNQKLDKEEYHKMLKKLDFKLCSEEIEAMMKEADKNNDGFIDIQEFQDHFYAIMSMIRRNLALHNIEQFA